MKLGGWIVVAVAAAAIGCTEPKAYTLHVNVSEPAKTRLCVEEVGDPTGDATLTARAADPQCQRWGNQGLDAPGVLAIDLEGQRLGEHYDLRVSQFTREASADDVKALLARVGANAKVLFTTLEQSLPLGAQRVIDKILDNGKLVSPVIADRIEAAIDAHALPEPPRAVAAVKDAFARFLDDKGKLLSAEKLRERVAKVKDGINLDYNAPAEVPLPRVRRFSAEDLAYLDQTGITKEEIAAFVGDWCTVASFHHPERADVLAALEAPPDAAAVSAFERAIALTPKDLAAQLLGGAGADPLSSRIDALIIEANNWAEAGAAARAYRLMRLGTTDTYFADNCIANLTAIGADVPDGLVAFAAAVRAHSDQYVRVVAPIYAAGLREVEQTLLEGTDGQLGTISLEPGKLELGLGVVEDGVPRHEIATYKSSVRGIERLALVFGPVWTACASSWHCFDRIVDHTEGDQRLLVRDAHQYDAAMAAVLHVTIQASPTQGIGAVIGYPIGSTDAASYNILLGVGWRHHSGLEIAAGVHVFRTDVLRAGFATPIDLNVTGNEALTADAVTDPALRAGAFILVGFAPDILSTGK